MAKVRIATLSIIAFQFISFLFSDILLFCSFTLSHPLYFSYFIFFSSYLLRLVSFLCPVFFTTTLLLLLLLTVSPSIVGGRTTLYPSEPRWVFLHGIYCSLIDLLRSGLDHENVGPSLFDELEAFIQLLDTSSSSFENMGATYHGNLTQGSGTVDMECLEEKVIEVLTSKKSEVNIIHDLLTCQDGSMGIKASRRRGELIVNSWSEVISESRPVNSGDYVNEGTKNHMKKLEQSLNSYGSMRKGKEWTKTLACKLYEERNNVDETEGMDSLWESYEVDTSKTKVKDKKEKAAKKKKIQKNEILLEDEEESDDEPNVQLCCLQALNFSTTKMNLGFRRPSVKRISEALRGISWLHRVGKHDECKN